VEYFLFMMVSVGDVGEIGEAMGVTPTSFPLQSLLEQPLFRGFVFLHRLPKGMPLGVFI
jgi:hypothetical protein